MADQADEVVLAEYNGGRMVLVAVLFLVLTLISVALRGYVRIFIIKSFRLDDHLMMAGLVVYILLCSFILSGCLVGLGRHNRALPQSREIEALKWQSLATATYVLDMMFIKMSIGIFLVRLSAGSKINKWAIYTSLAVMSIWSTVLFLWNLFQCHPVEAQWDFTIPNYTCVSSDQVVAAAYAFSVMTVMTDWLYALLPIPIVWGADMTKRAKVIVIAILGLGIFASVATIVRLAYLADLNSTDDLLFAGTNAMVWTLVEPGIAITAASLATTRPLLRKLRISGFATKSQQSGSYPLSRMSQSNPISRRISIRQDLEPTLGDQGGTTELGDLAHMDLESDSVNTRGDSNFTPQGKEWMFKIRIPGMMKSARLQERPPEGFKTLGTPPDDTRGTMGQELLEKMMKSKNNRDSALRRSEMYIIQGAGVGEDAPRMSRNMPRRLDDVKEAP